MDIDYLIQLLGNRHRALVTSFDQAFAVGDLERMNTLEVEIQGVNDTLYKLHLLGGINAAASATGMSAAAVVSSGINAIASASAVLPADQALQCLQAYDITSYATDPLHEQKISDILTTIGAMNSAGEIDAYIDQEAIGSPITGIMVILAAQTYNVDARLMLAIMEQDSRFGTAGLAIATRNPGNVGNTDSGATRTYASWTDGVNAVAEWLSRHRLAAPSAPVSSVPPPAYEPSPAPATQPPEPAATTQTPPPDTVENSPAPASAPATPELEEPALNPPTTDVPTPATPEPSSEIQIPEPTSDLPVSEPANEIPVVTPPVSEPEIIPDQVIPSENLIPETPVTVPEITPPATPDLSLQSLTTKRSKLRPPTKTKRKL